MNVVYLPSQFNPSTPVYMKRIYCLERHTYAPELNTLHYTDGTEVRVPQCTTIEEAVNYLKTNQQ